MVLIKQASRDKILIKKNHTNDVILEDSLAENCVMGFLSAAQFPCSKKQKC